MYFSGHVRGSYVVHGERPASLRAEMVLPLTGLSTEQEQKLTPITFLHYKSKIVTLANCLVIKIV